MSATAQQRVFAPRLLPSQRIYYHENHAIERRNWRRTIFGVVVQRKAWQQWFIGEEARAEYVDSNGNQDVRHDEQRRGEGCYTMLRALHLLRCVAQRKGREVSGRSGTMSSWDDAPLQVESNKCEQ